MMSGTGKDKKAKVEGGEGGSGTPSPELVRSIARIKNIQHELNQINVQAREEALKLEHKFNMLRKPFYARRNEVIRSIREFWLVAFRNHPIIGDLLTGEDQKILKHMISLDVEEADNIKSSFSISFSFSPNPYFEDEKLTKTYCFDDDENLNVLCKPINWKEGKGIFDGSSPDKGLRRPHTSKSFFCWFSEAVRYDGKVDEIANIIRDDLWANPLRHFLNKVDAVGSQCQEDSEEPTGGGDEDDDEEEEEDSEAEGETDKDDENYNPEDDEDDEDDDDDDDGDYYAEDEEDEWDYHAEDNEDDDDEDDDDDYGDDDTDNKKE